MLEAILGYNITDAWNVGIGGRYWAWNMRDGTLTVDQLGGARPIAAPARFNAERYGVFVQTSYKWGGTAPATAGPAFPTEAATPMNWTGFYVGGHVGGGWSGDHWSHPFGSTSFPSIPGTINVAGFGDAIRATGPLGGGQLGSMCKTASWCSVCKLMPARPTCVARTRVSPALAAPTASASSIRSAPSPAGSATPRTARWHT